MYFLSIIVFCCLILRTISRPSHVLKDYDMEAKDESYEDSNRSYSDYGDHNDRKSSLNQFSGNEPGNKNVQEESLSNSNDEEHLARSDQDYLENSNEDDVNQVDSAQKSHKNMLSTNNNIKRTAKYNKDNILLFQNSAKDRQLPKNEFNYNEVDGTDEQARYFKQLNVVHNPTRDTAMSDEKRFENVPDVVRDRRQLKDLDSYESVSTSETSTQKNELIDTKGDEETAIRKHIKKLSKGELDELLLSLSEDKRELLKNIIDSSKRDYDGVNKREITKKAGANEENSLVGNEQSDASKIQGGSANIEAESAMSNTENPENTKKESSESIFSKSTELSNFSEKSSDSPSIFDDNENIKLEKSPNKDNAELLQSDFKVEASTTSEQGITKNENKREANPKSFINSDIKEDGSEISGFLNADDFYCSNNEDLSQLWNEESSLNENNVNKREIRSYNQNSMKSLEESFPNAEDTSNSKVGQDMVPLIRVKRTDLDKVLEKRDANFISNLKVPFFSNALDNNEEESDEGSEFQDDGFFDRRANLAKSGEMNNQEMDSSTSFGEAILKNSGANPQPVKMGNNNNNNQDSDIVSLGSDTDAVLSGIEGVDDNLMYNSVSRNRRTADEFDNLNNVGYKGKIRQRNMPKLVSENENNEISERFNNAPHYQENDAFGSLPRNYEEDLGRFKRIRRLKPLINL